MTRLLVRFMIRGGFLAVMLMVIGVAGLWASFSIGRDAQVFAVGGVEVDATVAAKRTAERTGGSGTSPNAFNPVTETEYFVTLAYVSESGATHRVEQRVSAEYWAGVTQGDSVPIRHLPREPEVIELEADATEEMMSSAGWVGGAALALGGVLTAILWRWTALGVHLERSGIRATAEVTGVRHSGGYSFLQYRFTDSTGTVHTGQSEGEEDHDFSDMPPGTPVAIQYDKANPARNALSR